MYGRPRPGLPQPLVHPAAALRARQGTGGGHRPMPVPPKLPSVGGLPKPSGGPKLRPAPVPVATLVPPPAQQVPVPVPVPQRQLPAAPLVSPQAILALLAMMGRR